MRVRMKKYQNQKKTRKEVVFTHFPKAPKVSNYFQNDSTTKKNLITSNSVNNITATSVSSIVQSVQTCSNVDTSARNENSVPSDHEINEVLGDNNNDIPKMFRLTSFLLLMRK